MPDRAAAEAFVEAYRRTFETLDVDAIASAFTFPLQVAGDGQGVSLTVVDGPDAWRPQLERIIAAYRAIGVRHATVERLHVAEVTRRIAHAVVGWSLADADATRIYAFSASYLLVDTEAGPRIAAIAHDESRRLQMAVATARGGRPA